jgi:hypothetical protein
VNLKFFVDEDQFVHLRKFHQQARDRKFIQGKSPATCTRGDTCMLYMRMLKQIVHRTALSFPSST